MINLLVKLLGLGKLWDALDGFKTYIGAATKILSGLSGVCLALISLLGEIDPAFSAHDAGALLHFAQGLSHDPAAAAMLLSWGAIGSGISDIGLAHKHDKLLAAVQSGPSPAPDAGAGGPSTSTNPPQGA